MSQNKNRLLFLAIFFTITAAGCGTDKTTDILKQDVAYLKSQMADLQKSNTDADVKISTIENKLHHFEEKSKDLENQLFNLSAKVEEGPIIEMPVEEKAAPPPQPEAKEIPPPPKEEIISEPPKPEKIEIVPVVEKKEEDELKSLSSLSPDELYKKAYNHFILGEYDRAISNFKIFLDNHPKNDLADNSQYWIGECYYAKKEYTAALSEFKKAVENYPKGNKAPDTMLKIGYVHNELGDKKSAIKELNELIKKFPKNSAARLAKEKLKNIERGK
jgi:tol-pal system protein YbgF